MTSITTLARVLQTLLTTTAEEAARATGCVQRNSKLTGALLVQTLVFGWLVRPHASLGQLCQMAATLGVSISPQGLDQRLQASTAACLKQVLDAAVLLLIGGAPVAIPLLQRFSAIIVHDSTTISLPDALAEVWPGCGGRVPQGSAAALKAHVRLDLLHGTLAGLQLSNGRLHDRRSSVADAPLPIGSLVLEDLGYFALPRLAEVTAQGCFWLTRVKSQTHVVTADGSIWPLERLLAQCHDDRLDEPVGLGAQAQLPCRLLAVRLSPTAAERQRRRLRAEAQREGRTPSAARLALAGWLLFVTNVAQEQLTLDEALVLARARWQIELLFKLWKQHGGLATSRSQQPWRVLCEVYAKLLAMLIQHWIVLTGCWHDPARSLVKAGQVVREHARVLARAMGSQARLRMTIAIVHDCLSSGCQLNPRKRRPNTYQLLLNPSLHPLA